VIALLDLEFVKYIFEVTKHILKEKKIISFGVIVLIFLVASGKIKIILQTAFLIESIMYLIYAYRNKLLKYLYFGVNLNIGIAILQFIYYYIRPEIAYMIGPTNIANIIWGKYATETYTNFSQNFLGIVRVSGWSREAGFFNSLIIATLLVYHYVDDITEKTKNQYIAFFIAFIISLSKISLIPLAMIPVIWLRKYLNKIPYIIGIAFVIFSGIVVSNFLFLHNQYNKYYSDNYETFSHRFGGYSIILQINFKDMLFGVDNIQKLDEEIKENNYYLENIYKFNEFCGLPCMLINDGVIVFALFIITLKICKLKTADFWILTMATMTVNYLTLSSFVILFYFLILYFVKEENSDEVKALEYKKVLIINDFLTYGGAEQYALNLRKLLMNNNHEVYFLCFDNGFEQKINKISNKTNILNIKSNFKLNKVIFNPIMYIKIRKVLRKINPEVIIVNNMILNQITQYSALKGYYVVQVVHDYGKICPKSTCVINKSYDICEGYKNRNCIKNCKYKNSKVILFIKLIINKIGEILSKKYIKKFIAPSECLKNKLINSGYNAICINNPIEIDNCIENKKNDFLYVGNISDEKGIFKFIPVFSNLNSKYKLKIIGKCENENNQKKLDELLSKSKNIEYLGSMDNCEVLKYMSKAYCLVVPSLWIENYPTTIIEAKSQKTLIIGSCRGGIPELIGNSEFIFDIMDDESIKNVINKVETMNIDEYKKIVEKNYEDMIQKNNFNTYYYRLMDYIKQN
jgi:glycosyltransferase involved in cell wall biosynthesis